MELFCFIPLWEDIRRLFMTPFFALHPYFILLFLLMTVFMLFMLFVPLTSILLNVYREWRKVEHAKVSSEYKQQLFKYLVATEEVVPVFAGIEKAANKDILIDLFFELTSYMEGDDKKRLSRLFDKQKLNTYILRKIQSSFCFRTAYYLERLSVVSSDAIPYKVLEKLLSSPSPEVRMYAMQALILMHPDQIEALFSGYKYEMSLWEQMNYYIFFLFREIPVPDFHRLALSSNRSIALFAIRMVRMFNQRQNSIEGYESLLKNPDLEIQFEMFRTLAEFGYTNVNLLLSDILPSVSPQIRMQIMTYLSKTESADTRLLMEYYKEDQSPEFRLHILYCIYNFIKNGKEDIERFADQKEDRMLHDLSTHLITNVV